MVDVNIKITAENSQPLKVLTDLIKTRAEELGENIKDSVAATLINALISLRATTVSALRRKKFNIVVEDTGLYGGFSGKQHKMVARTGPSKWDSHTTLDARCVWLVQGFKQPQLHIYKVTPESSRKGHYYICCTSAKVAQDYEKRASLKRVEVMGNLGKNALGVAMAKISTKNQKADGTTTCIQSASKAAQVYTEYSDKTFYASVTDNLDYADLALKGGQSAVDVALMKACNKVASIIDRRMGDKLDQKLGVLFPEVKSR